MNQKVRARNLPGAYRLVVTCIQNKASDFSSSLTIDQESKYNSSMLVGQRLANRKGAGKQVQRICSLYVNNIHRCVGAGWGKGQEERVRDKVRMTSLLIYQTSLSLTKTT